MGKKKKTTKAAPMTGVVQIQPLERNRDVIDIVAAEKERLKTSTAYAACELIREAVASRAKIAALEANLGGKA